MTLVGFCGGWTTPLRLMSHSSMTSQCRLSSLSSQPWYSWKNSQVHSWLRKSPLRTQPTPTCACLRIIYTVHKQKLELVFMTSGLCCRKGEASSDLCTWNGNHGLSRIMNKKVHWCVKERLNESSFLLREIYEWEQDCFNEGDKVTFLLNCHCKPWHGFSESCG